MKKITITIGESIRVQPYETIKPIVTVEFEVPDNEDLEEFYQEKYKETKRIWNMHLYNLLYNADVRKNSKSVFDFAEDLVLGKEKFPKFILKQPEKEKENE
jgi:membrane-bound lytic murein transglycosylase MltF